MKKSLIAILATLFAFMSGTSSFANSENQGIVPDKLAWFTDSIVEQWTETNDPDSDIIEQAHFARVGGIDNEKERGVIAAGHDTCHVYCSKASGE